MVDEIKKVFISYSHDDESHKLWVYKLACDLVENGLDVVLDQWDLRLGGDLPSFMEKGMTSSDKVLVICTDNYIGKSNSGQGGAGYEKQILTSFLLRNLSTEKFIPVVRNVTCDVKTPTCLAGRLYTDFSNDALYTSAFDQLLREIYQVPLRPKPKLGINPFVALSSEPDKLGQTPTLFFHDRFNQAFPGVRGIEWFNDAAIAVKRLMILLKDPLVFSNGEPIWWWRFGNLQISSVSQFDSKGMLMDGDELNVRKVAAVNEGAYWQQFVYVEVEPSEPTGLYESNRDFAVETFGSDYEEFAVFEGHFITRAEYDDGAAVINGEPVSTIGKAKLRKRFLTPYNFVIAPSDSPINNMKFDTILQRTLDGMLKGEATINDLYYEISKLPKPDRH